MRIRRFHRERHRDVGPGAGAVEDEEGVRRRQHLQLRLRCEGADVVIVELREEVVL